MSDFSLGQAFGSGFGLMARKPVTMLAWGFVYLVATVVPLVLIMSLLAPGYFLGMRDIIASQGDPAGAQAAMMAMTGGGFALAQILIWLWSIATSAIAAAAVFRAVLEPDNRGFFYIRLGAQELWMTLLYLVFYIGFIVLAIICAIPIAIVFGGAAMMLRENIGAMIGIFTLLGLGLLVAILLIGVRFSMAAPMTFAERQFRLFESWALTRGLTWKLVGLALCLFLGALALVVAIYILFAVIFGVIFAALFGAGALAGGNPFESMATAGAAIPIVILVVIVGLGVYAYMIGAITALFAAPFANVYKQLRPSDAQVF